MSYATLVTAANNMSTVCSLYGSAASPPLSCGSLHTPDAADFTNADMFRQGDIPSPAPSPRTPEYIPKSRGDDGDDSQESPRGTSTRQQLDPGPQEQFGYGIQNASQIARDILARQQYEFDFEKYGRQTTPREPTLLEQLERFPLPPAAPKGSTQGARRLRRTDNIFDLRSLQEAQLDSRSLAAVDSGGSRTQAELFNPEWVLRWRETATTQDQGLVQSPLTPRPFHKNDLQKLYGQSEPDSIAENLTIRQPTFAASDQEDEDEDEDEGGPTYQSLEQMHRIQERLRIGGYHISGDTQVPHRPGAPSFPVSSAATYGSPPREEHAGPSGYYGGYVPKKRSEASPQSKTTGPILEPSEQAKAKRQGDPLKKPSPLEIHPYDAPGPSRAPYFTEDTQTYSTTGLAHALRKIYAPGEIPPAVTAALPSPHELASVSSPNTPQGASASYLSRYGNDRLETLVQKDRNYVSFFVDTLLMRLEHVTGELDRAIEVAEEKEVEKADMQGDINHWYGKFGTEHKKLDALERLVKRIVNIQSSNQQFDIVRLAAGERVDLTAIMGKDLNAPPE